MRAWKLVVEYDGRAFHGWQRQRSGLRTVQEEIENAVARMAGERVAVRGAGRTDAGVHALGQVASFRSDAHIPARGWLLGLNRFLPDDVSVRSAEEVDLEFDARRSARGKLYRYVLWYGMARSAQRAGRAWHVHGSLDLDRMRDAAAAFVGEHDFHAFRAADCDRKNPVRIVRRAEVIDRPPDARGGREIWIEIAATAFLKNMARILAGTIVHAGRAKIDAAGIRRLFETRDRAGAGQTAPAEGLYLVEVFYGP